MARKVPCTGLAGSGHLGTTTQKGTTMQVHLRHSFAAALGLCAAAFSLPAAAEAPKAAAPATAPAAQAEQPATKTLSVHDDWAVRCAGEGDARACEAVQTIQTADNKNILAHIAVRAKKDGPVHLIAQVPPGVWLPSNVLLKVKDVPDVVLTYKRCGRECTAAVELTADQLKALKASNGAGEIVFAAGEQKPIILPISFKGLGAALEASLKH